MKRRRFTVGQIIRMLREAEVHLSQGKTPVLPTSGRADAIQRPLWVSGTIRRSITGAKKVKTARPPHNSGLGDTSDAESIFTKSGRAQVSCRQNSSKGLLQEISSA